MMAPWTRRADVAYHGAMPKRRTSRKSRSSRRSSRKDHAPRRSSPRRRFGNGLIDHQRVRAIVSLAASKVEDPNTADWLRTDREGSWQKAAESYLEKTRDQAAKLGLSEEQVTSEIATQLAYEALTAQVAHMKKKRGRR